MHKSVLSKQFNCDKHLQHNLDACVLPVQNISPIHSPSNSFCVHTQVTALSKPAQLDALLARCGGGGGAKGAAKGAASWGACVLLFTDKLTTPPLYKSLAAQYAGKLVRRAQ